MQNSALNVAKSFDGGCDNEEWVLTHLYQIIDSFEVTPDKCLPLGNQANQLFAIFICSGYVFITVMFIGQLICSYMEFKAGSAKKLFYNISLIRTSYIGLIVSFVVGGLCMLISPLPYWVGVIVCAIVLVANVLSVIKATAAIDEIERIESKVKTQTFFIKSLTVDADTLMASAKSEAVKVECCKVYEAICYSDPMSNEALASVESQNTIKFEELSEAVKTDDANKVTEIETRLLS